MQIYSSKNNINLESLPSKPSFINRSSNFLPHPSKCIFPIKPRIPETNQNATERDSRSQQPCTTNPNVPKTVTDVPTTDDLAIKSKNNTTYYNQDQNQKKETAKPQRTEADRDDAQEEIRVEHQCNVSSGKSNYRKPSVQEGETDQETTDSTPEKKQLPKITKNMSIFLNHTEYTITTNTTAVAYSDLDVTYTLCPDSGSPRTIIDKSTLAKIFPDVPIRPVPIGEEVTLNGIGGSGPKADTLATITIRMRTTDKHLTTFLPIDALVVDHLSCGLLLGTDFLNKNEIGLLFGSPNSFIQRRSGKEFPIFSTKTLRLNPQSALLYTTKHILVQPQTGVNIEVRHRPLPPTPNGYLVRPFPQADIPLGRFGSLVNGIVDGQPTPIPFSNFGDTVIKIPAGTILGILEECPKSHETADVFLNMNDVFQGLPPVAPDTGDDLGGVPVITLPKDEDTTFNVSQADISDSWGTQTKQKVESILLKHKELFRQGLGQFSDGIDMPVPFKEGVDISDLKQAPYPQSQRDRLAMDSILNPMKADGALEDVPLGQPSPVASPAFVVYRNGKPRVVVDLRRVNTKLRLDAYPLPKQDTILSALGGSVAFSSLDMTKSFFQQKVAPEDKWKLAIVTAHRGHEQMTVASMGLATTPSFFQHRMEALFGRYLWQFVLVYIDDVIIFSKNINDHLRHLDTALGLLKESGVTLSLPKCHFAQPSISALGHHVSRLGLSTLEDKVEAVRNWTFPETLQQLETVLGFFGYYRKFIKEYAAIVEPLVRLKTIGFTNAPIKGRKRKNYAKKSLPCPRAEQLGSDSNTDSRLNIVTDELWNDCKKAFEEVKAKLCSAPTLAFPDFNNPFILYTDGSKQRGYGAALHQLDSEGVERPILFLSKSLSAAEKNYWPTELETGALVWALQKLPQYLDGTEFTVITDHQAIVDSFKGLDAANKKGPRLTNWRLFLAKFVGKMDIRHRAGKSHANADALSRVRATNDGPQEFSISHPRLRTEEASSDTTIHHIFCAPVTTRKSTRASKEQMKEKDTERGPCSTDESIPENNSQTRDARNGERDQTADAILANNEVQDAGERVTTETLQSASTFMSNEFIKSTAKLMPTDRTFGKVYRKMKQTYTDSPKDARITTFESFRFDYPTRLLFFRDSDSEERLCIPQKLVAQVLRIGHEDRAHVGTRRTYEYLRRHIFIPRLQKQTAVWVSNCPVCRAAKPSHRGPLGTLMPIKTPLQQMSTICTDFVTSFPQSAQGHNAVATITDPLTKFVSVLVGKDTFSAKDWAEHFYKEAYTHWGLPDKIISDRDSKFTSEFWTELCRWAHISLALTTAWHPQADGQSEITNKTLIHALRCAIAGRYDQSGWEDLIPHVVYVMNTSISASTGMTPWELRYGRKPRSPLSFQTPTDGKLSRQGALDYIENHNTLVDEARSAVALAQARMKINHDSGRTESCLQTGDTVYIKLAKGTDRGYHLLHNTTKLSFIKQGPYPITKVVHPGLSFEIQLPEWLPIHPIISIEHLEPAKTDPHGRTLPSPGPIRDEDGTEKYIIDKIHAKEQRSVAGSRTRRLHYKVSHLGYTGTEWIDAEVLLQDVPKLVKKFEDDFKKS